MSWLALVMAGCAGGPKDSGPQTLTGVDDCSDGDVSFAASEAVLEDSYCRNAVACGVFPGETYDECLLRYDRGDDGCELDESLYDGYRVCACAEAYENRACSLDVPDICTQPWWDCGPLTR